MGKRRDSDPDSEYGEPAPYDPTFNGPINKRGCTDIICCILFMAVILGYMAVGILAWLYGDPRHVLYARNSTGWYCGTGPNKDKPNLFYFDILKCATSINIMATALNGLQCPTTQVCVESCPSTFWAVGLKAFSEEDKAKVFNQSLCVPSINLENTKFVGHIIVSFMGLLIAMVVSLLFLLLLRFTAPVLVWVLILGVLGVGAYGIWHCYWEYDNHKQMSASINDIGFTTNFSVYLQVQETWLAFLIIISVVEAILILTLIFLRTRILIAIALIQESSKAVSHIMSALLYPVVTFVLLLICVAYWGATALYLATSGGPIHRVVALNSTTGDCMSINGTNFSSSDYPGCPSARCIFIKYDDESLLQKNLFNLQIYNAVAFLWCVNFVIALGQCTLAGAFASYYWAFNKPDDIPMFPVSGGFIRSLRRSKIKFRRCQIITGYFICPIEAQNPVARFILCCMKCCLWCLEKFIKFLNRNAYIMIAIYGKNFCVSAKNAFSLLMRNVVRVVVLDKVTDLLLFFGKLLVVGGVGKDDFRALTRATVVFGSYLIALGFFSVYSMCVDTLFLCFLEDLERNDGSLQKPYFMSKNLMKILSKSNKAPKRDKR
uniref:Choline transporter-like protein n=1 Tax=Echeneis naucrates TaxID=173247 RepID=A0A665UFL6_ECHNA